MPEQTFPEEYGPTTNVSGHANVENVVPIYRPQNVSFGQDRETITLGGTSTYLDIEPGADQPFGRPVNVYNNSHEEVELRAQVQGYNSEYLFEVSPATFTVPPAGRRTIWVHARLDVDDAPLFPAGEDASSFTLVLTFLSRRGGVAAKQSLVARIQPFHRTVAWLDEREIMGNRGRTPTLRHLVIANLGNEVIRATMEQPSVRGEVEVDLDQRPIRLAPGERCELPVRLMPWNADFWRPSRAEFELRVEAPPEPTPIVGYFTHPSVVPTWVPPALLFIVATLLFMAHGLTSDQYRVASGPSSQTVAAARTPPTGGLVMDSPGPVAVSLTSAHPGVANPRDVTAWRDGFVAVGLVRQDEQQKPAAWRSVNAQSWTEVPVPVADGEAGELRAVTEWAGQLAAIGSIESGDSWHPVVWTTADGSPMRRNDGPAVAGAARVTIFDVVAMREGLLAVGSVARSQPGADLVPTPAVWRFDGARWDYQELTPGGAQSGEGQLRSVIDADGLLVAGGTERASSKAPYDAAVWVSRDRGQSWSQIDSPSFRGAGNQFIASLTRLGSRLVGVGGSAGSTAVWASDKALSWTVARGPQGRYLDTAISDGRTLTAAASAASAGTGCSTVLATSSDGQRWTPVRSAGASPERVLGLAEHGNRVVAVGTRGDRSCEASPKGAEPIVWLGTRR